MDWFETQTCALPADRIYSGLLKELPRAGFLITSCDRASGFISVYQQVRHYTFVHTASILIEPESETSSTVLVGSVDSATPAFMLSLKEDRNRNFAQRILAIVRTLR